MRVGVDISPLVQTRAGTARHVRGLLGALRDRPGLESSSCSRSAAPGGSSSVCRDALWYPLGSARARRGLDVLHCTTFRGARSRSRPDRPHRARPRDPPRSGGVSALASPVRAAPGSRACSGRRRVVAVSEFTSDESSSSLDVPAERIRVVPNGVDPVFTPDGPAAEGDYVLAVATLEPRKNLAAPSRRRGWPASSSASSGAAAGAASRPTAGSASSRRRARGALPRRALRPLPVALRGLRPPRARGDGVRRRRSSRRAGRRWRRSRAARRCSSTRSTPPSIADGIDEARAPARRARRRSGSRAPASSRGRARPTRVEALAGARVSRVVVDADVLGRAAHRRRDVRAEPAPRAAGLARRGRAPPRRRHAPTGPRAGRGRGRRAARALAGAAHGLVAPARAPPARRRSLPHAVRAAAARALPVRRHRPRPLVRARPGADGPEGPARLSARRAARGAARGTRAHGLRADEARSRRALRRSAGADRRHAERRRPRRSRRATAP